MKLSTKGRYGLRAMLDLGLNADEQAVSIKSISERQGISENYLEQIIATLKKSGYVKSTRGPKGGYSLKMGPDEISVGDILRALEGDLNPVDCVEVNDNLTCQESDLCVTKFVWRKISDSINQVVDNISLKDLMQEQYRIDDANESIVMDNYKKEGVQVMDKKIYLDHAATTPTRQAVIDDMIPYFGEFYGNPSSIYEFAQHNKEALDKSRDIIAEAIGAKSQEVFFVSGGTEADNWAIRGIAENYKDKGNHIITTTMEHHAVLHTCEYLAKNGYEVTYLDVDENGLVSPEALEHAIKDNTILVSIMFANNEIGSIQPIKAIGEICREKGVFFHTDAVQAFTHVPIDVNDLKIDLMSVSGHKIYGPKGIGALYVRKGIRLRAFIHGGAQERSRRGGTENVPAIVGFGKAVEMAMAELDSEAARLTELRDYFITEVEAKIPYVKLNGDRHKRLPNNVNFSFEFIEGESLLIMLDMKGVCASSGSACTSGSLDPSHVLLAIGLPHEIAHGSLRITLGESTRKEDLDYVVESLITIVERLRDMSPVWEDYKHKEIESIIETRFS